MKIVSIVAAAAFLARALIAASAAPRPSVSYVVSMGNDAQFIESVSSLFAAVADLQRTITENLEWKSGNAEFAKLSKAKNKLREARAHLQSALHGTDQLLQQLTDTKRVAVTPQINQFKKKIGNLDQRLADLIATIDSKKIPNTKTVHKTILLALAGIGYGMEVSSSHDGSFAK